MASESLEIEIILKAPEPLVNSVVEGACFEPATSSMPGNRMKLNFKLERAFTKQFQAHDEESAPSRAVAACYILRASTTTFAASTTSPASGSALR